MGNQLLGVALWLALAGSAQGATLVVPDVIATYPTPGDIALTGGDFDAAGVLQLSVPYNPSAGVEHFAFDPDAGVFTPESGEISTTMPDGDWAINLSGAVVNYSMVYTGWADYCPDGTYQASGWGGSDITYGITMLGYNREVWGVTVRPDGEMVIIAGYTMNPCVASAPTLELVRITEGDFSLAEETVVAPMQGTVGAGFGMTHTTLDYDADNDLYWTLEHDTGSGYWFAGFDSAGVHRFRVPAPGYEARLIHHEDNRFFLIDGSSTLTLWELDLDASVGDWMVVGEQRATPSYVVVSISTRRIDKPAPSCGWLGRGGDVLLR